MAVSTHHIQQMLKEASDIAKLVNGLSGTGMASYRGQTRRVDALLQRAANLAAHAAKELEDEVFTSQEWPTV